MVILMIVSVSIIIERQRTVIGTPKYQLGHLAQIQDKIIMATIRNFTDEID